MKRNWLAAFSWLAGGFTLAAGIARDMTLLAIGLGGLLSVSLVQFVRRPTA